MTPERYQRVKAIFLDACDLPQDQRGAFIERQCAGDAELQQAVQAMLERDGESSRDLPTATLHGFRGFARRAFDSVADESPRDSRALPKRIGEFEIVRRVGEGGMGVVYEAQQVNPRRVVALKAIRPAYATPRMLRRFEFEVQVLGQLEHPGIARIYEAGTAEEADGRFPFFAMEFIAGQTITHYADELDLDHRERLELVARTCDAVHYAHLKGVIHRDLKPGNILVQGIDDHTTDATGTASGMRVGQPKILDFGVARAIDADAERQQQHTEAGQMVGTLPYMSPEQLSGSNADVDVRTDVYSLGVVMYEMLTGRLPFELARQSLVDAAAIIRHRDAQPPSAFDSEFRGDVDTIVLKALAKDPSQRYESAAQLAADIRRHLNDEPITARPASAMYTLRKLARRHKAVVSGVTIAVLGLVAGMVYATRQAVMATIAEREALEQRDRARDAEFAAGQQRDRAHRAERDAVEHMDRAVVAKRQADAINDFLLDMLSAVDPERTPNREIMMVDVLDTAASTIGERFSDDPPVEIQVRETIGRTYSSLAKFDKAAEHLRIAMERAAESLGEDNATTHNTRTNLALAYRDLDRIPEALELAQTAAEGLVRVAGPDDPNTLSARANLAILLIDAGRFEEALPMLEDVVARRRALGDSSSPAYLRNISALASVHNEMGRLDLAEPLTREAMERRLETMSATHPDVLTSKNNLAMLLLQQGRLDESRAILEELAETSPRVLGPDHQMVYVILGNLAAIHNTQGRHEMAQPLYEQVLEYSRRVLGDEHRDTLSAMNNLAGTFESQRRFDLAEPLYLDTLRLRRKTMGEDHPDTIASINNLGFFYRNTQRYRDAEPLFAEALRKFTERLGERHPSTVITMSNLGSLYNDMGLHSEAEPYNQKVNALAGEIMPDGHWFRGVAMMRWGISLSGVGRADEAQDTLLKAHAALEATLGPTHERTLLCTREIIQHFERTGDQAQASTWRQRLPEQPATQP